MTDDTAGSPMRSVASEPLVGVIVLAFNSDPWISETIISLQAQTLRNWTCLVIDDGSTDSTAQLVSEFAAADDRITLFQQSNLGIARTRNVGLENLDRAATLLMYLDADDVLLPCALQDLYETLTARPDAVGAFGLAEYIDESGDPVLPGLHSYRQRDRRRASGVRLLPVPAGADSTFDDVIVYGPIWPSCVALHRRSAIDAVGEFDIHARVVEDWDMYLRMSRRGPFAMVDHQVAWYRRHDSNATGDSILANYNHALVLFNAWRSPQNTPAQRKILTAASWRIRVGEMVLAARTARTHLRKRAVDEGRHRRRSRAVERRHPAAVASGASKSPPGAMDTGSRRRCEVATAE